MPRTYNVIVEVEDYSDSTGEDIEEILQEILDGDRPEGLPSDLQAHIVEVTDEIN